MHHALVHKSTKDSITVTTVSDGSKNCVLLVTGTIASDKDSVFDIIDTTKLANNPTNIRMDSIVFMVETGLKIMVRYRDQPFVLPLEGRSKIDLG
jgi:hypothetical protein